MTDIYLEELDKICKAGYAKTGDDSEEFSSLAASTDCHVPLLTLVDPFLILASRTGSSVTYSRISSSLLEPVLQLLKPAGHRERSECPLSKRPRLLAEVDHSWLLKCIENPAEMRVAIVKQMFDIASGPDTREGNRRRMYSLWKSVMAEAENESAG